jgi:predicted nucleotidyltransferase
MQILPETYVAEDQLAALCQSYHVAKLSLFGSALRADFDAQRSDFDMLVEFLPGASKSLFLLVELQDRLSQLFGRQVDLTTAGSLSKYFRDNVLATAKVIYDAA